MLILHPARPESFETGNLKDNQLKCPILELLGHCKIWSEGAQNWRAIPFWPKVPCGVCGLWPKNIWAGQLTSIHFIWILDGIRKIFNWTGIITSFEKVKLHNFWSPNNFFLLSENTPQHPHQWEAVSPKRTIGLATNSIFLVCFLEKLIALPGGKIDNPSLGRVMHCFHNSRDTRTISILV